MFVWFAITFWLYLQTRSVLATSALSGVYLATTASSGFLLGSLVDRFKKQRVMLASSAGSLSCYALSGLIFALAPDRAFATPSSPLLWVFVLLALFGTLAGNVRGIVLSTLVTMLVPEDRRDRANGLVGSATGLAFFFTSIASGLAIGFLGMGWILALAVGLTLAVIAQLLTARFAETSPVGATGTPHRIDIRGTIAAIRLVPGLFGLIFFNTFNNLLGGILMSLMDPYGLSLVSVQVWGLLWGFLSLGIIVGGAIVARWGLGRNPLRTLFLANIVLWIICTVFTIQASIVLLTVGMFIYLCLMPVIEASEQTILQRVIVLERQGRVFGFAQSVEQAASPITAFIIGPIAQFIFIPFMTTGAGPDLIGAWYGTGADRGMALLFSLTGIIGLLMTLLALRSRAFTTLSGQYAQRATLNREVEALSQS
jgi:DHA3 family multidrug efflux protein-like MFS transporter